MSTPVCLCRRTFRRLLPGSGLLLGMLLWVGGCRVLAAPVQANKSTGPLKIVDALFEDYEGWPSPFLTIPAGGEAVLNFRMEGFERLEGRDANDYPESRVRLEYDVELRDPHGVLVVPVKQDSLQKILGPQDDTWLPLVRWSAVIPRWAPTGDYPIRIRARDGIGEQQAEHIVNLRVRGEAIPAADALQSHDLEFAHAPEGPWTASRYFSLRDAVYVHFNVIGYRVAPDKRVWVEQDWTVLDEAGNVLIHRQNAVQEQSQEFYPPRFLTTNFQVELDHPQPGAYTLQLALRDRIGDQTYFQEAAFNLRP